MVNIYNIINATILTGNTQAQSVDCCINFRLLSEGINLVKIKSEIIGKTA